MNKGDFDKEGSIMRKVLLSLIVPGLVLTCMLTISCKEQSRILDPGDITVCSTPPAPSRHDYTDFQEPADPDSGDEASPGQGESQDYVILCAPQYEPQYGAINWNSRDNSAQARIEASSGGILNLHVEAMPNPVSRVTYDITADIPPEALPRDTTLRLVVPQPGYGAFGILVIGDRNTAEPYTLTGTVYLDFKIHGLDVSQCSSDDLVLLRWNERQARWVETSGNVAVNGQNIIGNLVLTSLGKFAVGSPAY